MSSVEDEKNEIDSVENIVQENIKDIEYRLEMMLEMRALLTKQLKKDRARLRKEKKLLERIHISD